MDSRNARDVSGIDSGRRSRLGGASVGGIAIASLGAIALLKSSKAEASGISGWYDVKADFGATGNGTTDDTVAIRNGISTASSAQIPLFLPPGTYKTTSALAIPSNTMIVGSSLGMGFACALQPNGCPAFDIGGATTSFQCLIRDLTIQPIGTAPDHIISIDNSYSISIRNVRIHNAQAALTTATILLLGDPAVGGTGHGASANIIWDNIIARNDSAQPVAVVLAQSGCGSHRFIELDLESGYDLFVWNGGQIDLVLPYFERSGRYSVNCQADTRDTTSFLNTHGGLVTCSPSAYCCALNAVSSFNSYSTAWSNTGASVSVYVFNPLTNSAQFHGTVPNVSGSGTSQFTGGFTGWQRSLTFPGYTLKASKALSVTVPNAGQATTTISVPGTLLGSHYASANMSVSLGGVQLSAYVSAANTVTVVAQNNQSSSVNLNGTLYVDATWM